MKTVIVTPLILLVLGTVWTLFLEHEKRRFVESLPKPPIMVTQPVDAVDTSAESEESDSATAAPGQWIPIGGNASTEGKQTEVAPSLSHRRRHLTSSPQHGKITIKQRRNATT